MQRLKLVTEVLSGLFKNEFTRAFEARDTSDASGLAREQLRARDVRLGLERLGPFYVKLGQMLSTRPDIVPPAVMVELEKLHDRVSPAPFSTFEPVLEDELGPDWKERFQHVELLEPLGVASLAQVYGATLRNGDPAVIKIQRPGIKGMVLEDMRMMRRAARMIGKCAPRFHSVVDVEAMLGVLFDAMRPELDFNVEASHMEEARRAVRDFQHLSVPEVVWSSERVLVQTLAPGRSIRHVDRAAMPVQERTAIGKDLLAFTYHGFFVNRVFHADPHPGNIFVQPGAPASLIDWGMVGRLDRSTSLKIMLVLLNLAENDGQALAKSWIELGYATEWADVPAFMSDMAALTPKIASASLEELDFGVTLTSVLERSTKRGIKTNPVISVLGKAFANIEGSVRCVAPELSITDVFHDQMRGIMTALAREQCSTTRVARVATELMLDLDVVPGQLRTVLRDLANRELSVRTGDRNASQENRFQVPPSLVALGGAALWLHHRRNRPR
ncbi:ABC1 kinase family protein [Saccharopolyspora halophila]|uniref:ABC1 kinase family protein n=1 Tax=Saccharopolyspora halophila TaxID=405551 RepID=UPI0031D20A2D